MILTDQIDGSPLDPGIDKLATLYCVREVCTRVWLAAGIYCDYADFVRWAFEWANRNPPIVVSRMYVAMACPAAFDDLVEDLREDLKGDQWRTFKNL